MSSAESVTMFEDELKRLECHFTWDLRKADTDLNFLEVKFSESLSVLQEYEGNLRVRCFNYLAYVKHLQGFEDKALEYLGLAEKEETTGNENNCIVMYGNLAWLHHHMGEASMAQTYIQKVEDVYKAFPTEPPSALHREVQSERAWSLLKFSRKHYERANECFRHALQAEPGDAEWTTGYAFSLFRLEGLETREDRRIPFEDSPAVKQLKKALRLDPDNAMTRVYLGLKCYKNKRNAEAWEHMRKALAMAPCNLSVALQAGKFMKKEQCYDMALGVLRRMLKRAPNSSRLHHEIASNYRWKAKQVGDEHNPRLLNPCIRHLEEGARLNPSFIYPQVELALRYSEVGDAQRAEHKFQELFALPDLKPADLQACHRMYGDFHLYRLGSEETAVQHYKQGMTMQNISTEWKRCRIRLLKILDYRRSNVYQIREFVNSFKRGGGGGEDPGM